MVVAGSNCAATLNTFVFNGPQSPLSAAIRITPRFRT
jgi:hypothetical protein